MTRSIMSLVLTASLATTGQGFRPAAAAVAGGAATSTGTTGFVATGGSSFFSVGARSASRELGRQCFVDEKWSGYAHLPAVADADEVEPTVPCRCGVGLNAG